MNYLKIDGSFSCSECGWVVKSMRFWFDTHDVSWKCPKGHITTVSLAKVKKRKSDYV